MQLQLQLQKQTNPKEQATAAQRPCLSTFTDFRLFLSEFYNFKVKTQSSPIRAYSYATFSAAADIKSPNYLRLIIQGKRNLSLEMTHKFAKAMQLSKEDTEEFTALVLYGQAKEPLERNRFLKDLADLRVRKQLKTGELKSEAWERVPSWVTWVLYAMADQKNVDFDLENLRKLMRGKTNLDEIKRCYDKLIASGELVKDKETGQVKKGRHMIQRPEEVPAALVRKLQSELIYLGLESLFQDAPSEREFGALTMSLTEKEFNDLKFELRHFRKKIYKNFLFNRESGKGDRVFQMNIQLFPVSEPCLDNKPDN